MKTPHTHTTGRLGPVSGAKNFSSLKGLQRTLLCGLSLILFAGMVSLARAVEPAAAADHASKPVAAQHAAPKKAAIAAASTDAAPELVIDLKKALRDDLLGRKKLNLIISDKPAVAPTTPKFKLLPKDAAPAADAHTNDSTHGAPAGVRPAAVAARPRIATHAAIVNPRESRDYIRAKAAALTGHETIATIGTRSNSGGHAEVHWSYSGDTGPKNWGQLKPEFGTCASGKRQSPINIEEAVTLQGPAEPLQFNYSPSNAVVINNGHTIQVDVQGNNTLTVRGSTYSLLQLHFHSPSEEQVNSRNFAMVAHLVHKNSDGQLAVVAVLLDPGMANTLIHKIWTYMPLDVNDQVRMPENLLDINELLPKDQRYFQFMGSLTTPPCTEGVLWMVFKQPTQLSKDQVRLFQQIYPNNARPIQALSNRQVRNAQ